MPQVSLAAGLVSEDEEEKLEGDKELEPQLQVQMLHGRNVKCTSFYYI